MYPFGILHMLFHLSGIPSPSFQPIKLLVEWDPMEPPLWYPPIFSKEEKFYPQYGSVWILTCVQQGFSEITQQANLPLRKKLRQLFLHLKFPLLIQVCSDSSSTICSWSPTTALSLSANDICCSLHWPEMKEKTYSKLNMMFTGFHCFADSLRQDSLSAILAEQWYFYPFSNTNEAFQKHLWANH